MRGSVIDMAVGLIIGKAFGDVIQSLVDDVILPPIGLLLGGVDFANLTIKMHRFASPNTPPVLLRYGAFIQHIIYLLVVSLTLFLIIVLVGKLRKNATKEKTQEQYTELKELSEDVKVLLEIRDLLASKTDVKS
ncbi:unnamed protein product [Rotaria sp. Silwood2]|nr:unnamed protein product [Rotaria sp. Silwood2]CAF2637249.1 unnamed protein product [Rotaria sp. Silwood2]CAF2876573.1 unnamed protein product [Rotaria sp. Silwood2]CAF3432091.1 unnamed protein product [Rotaria sp. Silwood2]